MFSLHKNKLAFLSKVTRLTFENMYPCNYNKGI